jgi:four helix bundle protein
MAIAQKEINETIYWIELMCETKYLSTQEFESIHTDAIELLKLLTSTIKTAKHPINH